MRATGTSGKGRLCASAKAKRTGAKAKRAKAKAKQATGMTNVKKQEQAPARKWRREKELMATENEQQCELA